MHRPEWSNDLLDVNTQLDIPIEADELNNKPNGRRRGGVEARRAVSQNSNGMCVII
jgi:hypothetical protein